MSRNSKKILAEHEAYQAMLRFLERHFDRSQSDDIAVLLGSASLLDDGSSADPALTKEWHECVAEVLVEAEKNRIAAE